MCRRMPCAETHTCATAAGRQAGRITQGDTDVQGRHARTVIGDEQNTRGQGTRAGTWRCQDDETRRTRNKKQEKMRVCVSAAL